MPTINSFEILEGKTVLVVGANRGRIVTKDTPKPFLFVDYKNLKSDLFLPPNVCAVVVNERINNLFREELDSLASQTKVIFLVCEMEGPFYAQVNSFLGPRGTFQVPDVSRACDYSVRDVNSNVLKFLPNPIDGKKKKSATQEYLSVRVPETEKLVG